jgi:hypothetical protein
MPTVLVYIATYRRPLLLKRALQSVCQQTCSNWEVRVVNDDPEDDRVGPIVDGFKDARVKMLTPVIKRGPARAFNEVFRARDCEFSALLEDDNWWEPQFLERMQQALKLSPHVDVACGNERIWKERADGRWEDTGRTIWSFSGEKEFNTDPVFACGSAKLCNSSMLVRRRGRPDYVTPDDLPVDVTEHFRERVVHQPILLVSDVLVNFSQTLATHRASRGGLWGEYQAMLTASVFASLPPERREQIASRVFATMGSAPSPRSASLLSAAVCSPEASVLWQKASPRQKGRFLLGLVRRPQQWSRLRHLRRRRKSHWDFLLNSRCNREWAKAKGNSCDPRTA